MVTHIANFYGFVGGWYFFERIIYYHLTELQLGDGHGDPNDSEITRFNFMMLNDSDMFHMKMLNRSS